MYKIILSLFLAFNAFYFSHFLNELDKGNDIAWYGIHKIHQIDFDHFEKTRLDNSILIKNPNCYKEDLKQDIFDKIAVLFSCFKDSACNHEEYILPEAYESLQIDLEDYSGGSVRENQEINWNVPTLIKSLYYFTNSLRVNTIIIEEIDNVHYVNMYFSIQPNTPLTYALAKWNNQYKLKGVNGFGKLYTKMDRLYRPSYKLNLAYQQ